MVKPQSNFSCKSQQKVIKFRGQSSLNFTPIQTKKCSPICKSKSYISLTPEQKVRFRTEFSRSLRSHEEKTAAALAAWATAYFSLHVMPCLTTVRRFLREKEMAHCEEGRIFKAASFKSGANYALERQLYNLMCHQSNNRRNINGYIIRAQANRLQTGFNDSISQD